MIYQRTNADETMFQYVYDRNTINFKKIIKYGGANINSRNRDGYTPLIYAVINNSDGSYDKMIASMVSQFNDFPDDIDLDQLSQKEQDKMILDVEATDSKNKLTALQYASSTKSTATVSRLLKMAEANPNVGENTKFGTPLHICAADSNKKIATILIQYGADVDAKNLERKTPLMVALENGNTGVADVLISAGAEVNVKNRDKETPLHLAVLNSDDYIVKKLLSSGADVNAKDSSKRTPLAIAEEEKNKKIIDLLIKYGAED